jgi:hypothetical protein
MTTSAVPYNKREIIVKAKNTTLRGEGIYREKGI